MKYEHFEELKADRSTTFDLIDHLRVSFEEFCNTYHKPLPYMDAFMGVHNFHKLIISDIVHRSGMNDPERIAFLKMSVDTYAEAINRIIEEKKYQ